MAKIKGNVYMQGTTGMIGKQIVYKVRNGVPYSCNRPNTKSNRKPTPNQKNNQERLNKCSKYGAEAIKDDELKKAYAAAATPIQSAYNVAWKDAWHPPQVVSIVTKSYKGQPGDILFVHATDNFKVVSVQVYIFSGKFCIESGEAVNTGDSLMWMYTATKAVDLAGARIVARAYDRPGNEGVMEVVL